MAKVDTREAARLIVARAAELRAKAATQLFDKTKHELTPDEWEWFRARTHAKQFELLSSECQFKALQTCRRWGKTTNGIFEVLIHDKKFPKSTIFYIVPDSKSHARRLFWRPFQEANLKLNLGLTFHETDKRITTPNGTDILLFGAHDKDAAIQLRGDQSGLSLAILDECKDFGPHFEEVVTEAVIPALRDWGGTLILQGSPGNVLDGMFWKITTSDPAPEGWHVVRGKVWDNTFIKDARERDPDFVWKKYYAPLGYSRTAAKVRRELDGEWCSDDTERVYLYDAGRNSYAFDGEGPHGLPAGPNGQQHEWSYCLGLDLGEQDANAFVVGAFSDTCRDLYVVDCYARSHMAISEIYQKYRELEAKFGTFTFAVADTGGYGRGIVTELQNRYGLPLEAVQKGKDKLGTIALMNSDFLQGRIKCNPESPLAKEWLKLTKRIRPTDKKVLLDHTDLGDAALYMHKTSLHWAGGEMVVKPLPDTPEYFLEAEKAAIDKASEAYMRRQGSLAPSEYHNE